MKPTSSIGQLPYLTWLTIDECITAAEHPPPFNIPRLHFVKAGLLFVHADRSNGPQAPGGSRSGTVRMIYLAEEIIHGKFFKYIHNGDTSPCWFTDPDASEIAKFLSFTQHVQYVKTGGQVYILDYQGKGLSISYIVLHGWCIYRKYNASDRPTNPHASVRSLFCTSVFLY